MSTLMAILAKTEPMWIVITDHPQTAQLEIIIHMKETQIHILAQWEAIIIKAVRQANIIIHMEPHNPPMVKTISNDLGVFRHFPAVFSGEKNERAN